jgi:hypothetical protein
MKTKTSLVIGLMTVVLSAATLGCRGLPRPGLPRVGLTDAPREVLGIATIYGYGEEPSLFESRIALQREAARKFNVSIEEIELGRLQYGEVPGFMGATGPAASAETGSAAVNPSSAASWTISAEARRKPTPRLAGN